MIHKKENNPESQQHLNENRKPFTEGCKRVYRMLMYNHTLTVKSAIIDSISSSLPRRIKDLTDTGVLISNYWHTDTCGKKLHKVWHMTDDQIKENKKRYK